MIKIILILFIYILLLNRAIAKGDREARKQKLRSAFRQSLLTADTVHEDIDPSDEEQTATLAPASISTSLRGGTEEIHQPAKEPELPEESTQPIIKSSNNKRRKSIGLTIEIDNENPTTTVEYNQQDHNSIRISFESMLISTESNKNIINVLQDTILSNVIQTWSNVLSVISINNKLYPSSTTCGSIDIPLKHLRDGVENTDILIYLSTQDDSYCNNNSPFAYSTICNLDQNYRPIVANIAVCNNALMDLSTTPSSVQKLLVYEVGRILGLSPSLFQYYRNPETNIPYGTQSKQVTCVDGSTVVLDIPNILQQAYPIHGRKYFEVVTSTVLQVVRNHFNCQMLSGAKLDNSPLSESCFGGFGWDERYYYQENMSTRRYYDTTNDSSLTESITALSLALLEDSSWYKANYKDAIVPSFGHGAGCGFLEGDCLVSDQKKIPSYSKEFFCSLEEVVDGNDNIKASGCDVSHLAKAECDSMSSPISDIFDVLKNRGSGVYTLQQTILSLEETDSSYTCPMRTKNAISCLDTSQTSNIAGEVFGPTSKCFDTTTSSICLQAKCNSNTHKVEIIYEGKEYTCNHSGEKIELSNGEKSSTIILECPKIETACPNIICPANCSGKGMCDYSLDIPICICDDPFDTSPGCWES